MDFVAGQPAGEDVAKLGRGSALPTGSTGGNAELALPILNPDGRRPMRYDAVERSRHRWEARGLDEAPAMAVTSAFLRSSEIILAVLQRTLKPYKLTWSRYQVLGLLTFSREGNLGVGRLGDVLRVHPASMTNTLNRLEADNLVQRRPDPVDRRGVLCELTPEGQETWERATAAVTKVSFGMTVLDPDEIAALWPILAKLRSAYGDFVSESEGGHGEDVGPAT